MNSSTIQEATTVARVQMSQLYDDEGLNPDKTKMCLACFKNADVRLQDLDGVTMLTKHRTDPLNSWKLLCNSTNQ